MSPLTFGAVHAVSAVAGADLGSLAVQTIVAFGTGMTLFRT